MLNRLQELGIPCTYVLINAVPTVIKDATKVIMGASAVFSNGAMMSRVGSSVVATIAHHFKIPVIVLCGSYKFSDAVRLDSFVWNEIGNSDELVENKNQAPTERNCMYPHESPLNGPLSGWRDIDSLKLLNIHYDVTPAKFITVVCFLEKCNLNRWFVIWE
jgi:translation initiation factor eIF-2B subunit delta